MYSTEEKSIAATNYKTMKIIVNGYTYKTDEKAEIGDTAILPTADWLRDVKGDTWEGEITATESDYDGYCKSVIKIVKK
jgi:hypothetical protein|tara:strand:- start:365 stop:601 length:237 start_codon:yes stop_codon:yes gene_type:complete